MNRKDWFTACSAVEKEALYRAELENYSEKLVVNGEGRIVFINEKYAAEFGKTPADDHGGAVQPDQGPRHPGHP